MKEKYDKIPFDEPFKLTHNKKNIIQPPYEYISNGCLKKESKVDENGNVKTGPRNFYTSSFKKNKASELFGSYQYHLDPYENRKAQDLKEVVEHRRRMLSAKPFCSNNRAAQTFTSDFDTYGGEDNREGKRVNSLYFVVEFIFNLF